MILEETTKSGLLRLEGALRRGEPVRLRADRDRPLPWPADELGPLLDEVEARPGGEAIAAALRPWLPPPARAARRWRVTAVIPSHRQTPLGLAALRAQDCDVEVLVLANGPPDAAIEGDRVLRVPWRGHGPTRQLGVEVADREFVLLTVDDALPRGRGVVSAMVEALVEGGYDAVFGRQLPWPSSDPVTRSRLRGWTPPGEAHREVTRHDHVFALYRRETLLRSPLPDAPIAEDLLWRQGRRIGYVPGAPVVHAHPRDPSALYRRNRDIHRAHVALGEPPRIPSTRALLRALPGTIQPSLEALRADGPRAALREWPASTAELLGQWRARRG